MAIIKTWLKKKTRKRFKITSVSLDYDLWTKAKAMGINISSVLNMTLARIVAKQEGKKE